MTVEHVPSPAIDAPSPATDAGAVPRPRSVLLRRLWRGTVAMCWLGLGALCAGFLWFAFHIASDEVHLDRAADGIVALTGGASRLDDAVELLASGRGRRLLISGVAPTTNAADL